jgi:8-oxo-dGTP pyrophosphatase MutT (NUDIX family)
MALFTRNVVKAVIKAEDTGRYFIIRSTIPIMPGWSLVGGGMEKGENELEALTREVREELRVGPDAFSTINKRNGTYSSQHVFFGIPIAMETCIFDALVPHEADFKPRPNWEVAEYRWVSGAEMEILLGTHYLTITKYSN